MILMFLFFILITSVYKTYSSLELVFFSVYYGEIKIAYWNIFSYILNDTNTYYWIKAVQNYIFSWRKTYFVMKTSIKFIKFEWLLDLDRCPQVRYALHRPLQFELKSHFCLKRTPETWLQSLACSGSVIQFWLLSVFDIWWLSLHWGNTRYGPPLPSPST